MGIVANPSTGVFWKSREPSVPPKQRYIYTRSVNCHERPNQRGLSAGLKTTSSTLWTAQKTPLAAEPTSQI